MLDRGFALYERFSREAPDGAGIAPAVLYDLAENPLGPSVRELFAARIQADAARAVALGLGGMEAVEPPPLYSFDYDIGRLAVTTPKYSTAVLPVNLRAVPYGGIELARLFDRNQRVVSNIAGPDVPFYCNGAVVESARDGREAAREDEQRKNIAAWRCPKQKTEQSPHAHHEQSSAGNDLRVLCYARDHIRLVRPAPQQEILNALGSQF